MRRVLLLAPLALLAAACGGSKKQTTTSASGNPLASAATATEQAGSEDVTLKAKVTVSGQTFLLDGTGAYDQQATVGDLKGTLAVPSSGSTPIEEVFKGTTVYLHSPVIAALAGGGKPWLSVDLSKSSKVLGIDVTALTGENPSDVLKQLGTASGPVTTVGKEQVDGVSTTHYSSTINANPVDVWVDGKDLIRKVHLDYTTQGAKSSAAHIVLDMSLSNFGINVSATPPPASQVSPLSA